MTNITPLTLGPHGTSCDDVYEAIGVSHREMEAGVKLKIHGKETLVFASALGFMGDMPQQADNTGFMRSNGILGCRVCFVMIQDYGDLSFDVIHRGRYHSDIILGNHEVTLSVTQSCFPLFSLYY